MSIMLLNRCGNGPYDSSPIHLVKIEKRWFYQIDACGFPEMKYIMSRIGKNLLSFSYPAVGFF